LIAASLLLAVSAVAAPSLPQDGSGGWKPDRLTGFEARTFTLPDDYDGPVTATLVRRPHAQKQSCAVLYLHGWADYFFQVELADFFEQTLAQTAGRGCDFFALDLRKYGRSLPEGYKYPNFARDLDEYFPEITEALDVIRRDGYPWVLLNGHSTGALVAARYLQDGPRRGDVKALFLNSPFLDFNSLQVAPAHVTLTKFVAEACWHCYSGSPVSRWYARSLHRQSAGCADCYGEQTFDLRLKPLDGFRVYFAWVRAIARAQERVRIGGITQPVLVLHSDRSEKGRSKRWKDGYRRADLVLDVEDITREALKLGTQVTLRPITGGVHDLVLSDPGVRSRVFDEVTAWLRSIWSPVTENRQPTTDN
jgi:alpha-beta hydrolase superfamily lysophospholipase